MQSLTNVFIPSLDQPWTGDIFKIRDRSYVYICAMTWYRGASIIMTIIKISRGFLRDILVREIKRSNLRRMNVICNNCVNCSDIVMPFVSEHARGYMRDATWWNECGGQCPLKTLFNVEPVLWVDVTLRNESWTWNGSVRWNGIRC